jgi:hypothetical protein
VFEAMVTVEQQMLAMAWRSTPSRPSYEQPERAAHLMAAACTM